VSAKQCARLHSFRISQSKEKYCRALKRSEQNHRAVISNQPKGKTYGDGGANCRSSQIYKTSPVIPENLLPIR
jgi:hypothetical protein